MSDKQAQADRADDVILLPDERIDDLQLADLRRHRGLVEDRPRDGHAAQQQHGDQDGSKGFGQGLRHRGDLLSRTGGM